MPPKRRAPTRKPAKAQAQPLVDEESTSEDEYLDCERQRKRPRVGGNPRIDNHQNVAQYQPAAYQPQVHEPLSMREAQNVKFKATLRACETRERFHREQWEQSTRDANECFQQYIREVEMNQAPAAQIQQIAGSLNHVEQAMTMIFMLLIFSVANSSGGTSRIIADESCTTRCYVESIKALVTLWFVFTLAYRLRSHLQVVRDYWW